MQSADDALQNGSVHRRGDWEYDIPRTLRFAAFGFGMGPIIGRWNFVLERYFPLRSANVLSGGEKAPVSLRALGKRVAADQLFMYVLLLSLHVDDADPPAYYSGHQSVLAYSLGRWESWRVAMRPIFVGSILTCSDLHLSRTGKFGH